MAAGWRVRRAPVCPVSKSSTRPVTPVIPSSIMACSTRMSICCPNHSPCMPWIGRYATYCRSSYNYTSLRRFRPRPVIKAAAQSRAARIAGLRTAPLPARSSPASQHSGDGGLPGKKIALDLQLPDLAMQIVDHLLRIFRRRLAAARKQLARALHQLLFPVADHRRMNPKLRRQLRQGLLPRQRRHRHSRLEFPAVLLPLYAHVSRPLDRSALSLSCWSKIRSRRKANADDLVQDVLVQALANAHLWQPGSDLRAWLYTIMRNRFLAEVNRSGRSASALKEISVAEPASVTHAG